METRIQLRRAVLAMCALFVVGCGGGGDGPTDPPVAVTPVVTTIGAVAGDDQEARVGTAVATLPAVVVKDQNGRPMANVPVAFTVTQGGGTVTGESATTNASGIATAGGWVLGATPGPNVLTATATGGSNPSATITARARYPRWTFMVYLAADNTLTPAGIQDIDEMEAAGYDPEVQVVVQAEFSQRQLELRGCNASCFNRSNFNTFRYVYTGAGAETLGPNGTTIDIGNRDMTDPLQLHEFVSWAKQVAPAERYALMLWNHGGGYSGLIEDATSAGHELMTLAELRSALTGVGALDVVDFDMCLMGAAETLVSMRGLASTIVFSEELEPGEGNPYREILDALQSAPTSDARAAAEIMVDQYHASFDGHRASTTKSAYDLTQFAPFEAALETLGGTLRTNLSVFGTAVDEAASTAQHYDVGQLKDVGDFLDSLHVRVTDAGVRTKIDAVKQANSSFRIANRARTGTSPDASDVSRSTGLTVLMPGPDDLLPDAGPSSFAAYDALYPGREWTQLVAAVIASRGAVTYVDQGSARFEAYLVWDPASVASQADVDLWILEPDGELHIPYLGTITPNGHLTNESINDATYYEGYLTNRYIQVGEYHFYANLWADPANFQPVYNLAYRYDQVSDFQWYFSAPEPRLSGEVSWLDDPTPTFSEVHAGAYTDLQYVVSYVVSAPALAANVASNRSAGAQLNVMRDGRGNNGAGGAVRSLARQDASGEHGPRITRAQIETVRNALAARSRQPGPKPATLRTQRLSERFADHFAPRRAP